MIFAGEALNESFDFEPEAGKLLVKVWHDNVFQHGVLLLLLLIWLSTRKILQANSHGVDSVMYRGAPLHHHKGVLHIFRFLHPGVCV